jgi:hypothetical protein
MANIIIPPWIQPEEENEEWTDDDSSVFRPELGAGQTQRQSYGDLNLKLSRFHTVRQEEMAMLLSVLQDTSGRYNVIHSKPHRTRRGAAISSSELATNGTFANGTTGWSVSDATQIAVVEMDRTLRVKRVANALSATVNMASITTVTGGIYVIRVFVREGRGVLNFVIRAGTAAGGFDLVTGSVRQTQGLYTERFAATGTTTHINIQDAAGGKVADDFMDILYVSVARCANVNGSSQTGSTLAVNFLGGSVDEILLPGDWISVGDELKMVTAPLHSNSSGAGLLRFKPALFRSPSDLTPVVLTDPMGRFLASDFRVRNKFGTDAEISYMLEHHYE